MVADRLLALRLPARDANRMVADLRLLDLGDRADAIVAALRLGHAANPVVGHHWFAPTPQGQMQLALTEAVDRNDYDKAVAIGRQLLNRDPSSGSGQSIALTRSMRLVTINALRSIGRLDEVVRDLTQQADANPTSVRLNWLAAEIYAALPDSGLDTARLKSGPHWLKLHRTGSKLSAYTSEDGATWIPA